MVWATFFLNTFFIDTETEVAQWYKGFMSDCPSGYMTIADYRRVCESFFPNGVAENFARFVFNAFNLEEENASLNFENFLKYMSLMSRGTLEEKQRCELVEI